MTNSEQVAEEIRALGLTPAAENIPTPIPVVETNPRLLRRVTLIKNATSASNLFTASTTKDTFITGLSLSATNNVASQASAATISLTPKGGASGTALSLVFHTTVILDTNHAENSVIFPFPLQIERGTAVTLAISNVAVMRATAYGYESEPAQ